MPMNTKYPTATLLRRLGAILYDSLLLFALLMIAALPVVLIVGNESGFLKSATYSLYLYSVGFLFYGWFWTHGGQTLGMRSWKLQLIRNDNQPVGWDSALYRYLIATVSLFLFGLGFVWILFDKQRLAWHDLLSKTRIIVNPDIGRKPEE